MGQLFKEKLKKWRGSRPQKQAASLLDVPRRTYEGWEQGKCPASIVQQEIQRRMETNPIHHEPK